MAREDSGSSESEEEIEEQSLCRFLGLETFLRLRTKSRWMTSCGPLRVAKHNCYDTVALSFGIVYSVYSVLNDTEGMTTLCRASCLEEADHPAGKGGQCRGAREGGSARHRDLETVDRSSPQIFSRGEVGRLLAGDGLLRFSESQGQQGSSFISASSPLNAYEKDVEREARPSKRTFESENIIMKEGSNALEI